MSVSTAILINAGISDYIVKPLTQTLAQSAIDNLLGVEQARQPARRSARSRARSSRSSARAAASAPSAVAANLAWHLANKENRRVALVDLDMYYGTCALMLDVPAGGGLREALENPQRVDELFLERSMLRSGDKLHVLASEENLEVKLTPDPESLTPLLTLLRKQFHYVVVDAPRAHREMMHAAALQSNTAVIVLDQTANSIRDTLRLRQFTETSDLSAHRTILALNRVGERRGRHRPEEPRRHARHRCPGPRSRSIRRARSMLPMPARPCPRSAGRSRRQSRRSPMSLAAGGSRSPNPGGNSRNEQG
jgi:pilus assembly protein CpaE